MFNMISIALSVNVTESVCVMRKKGHRDIIDMMFNTINVALSLNVMCATLAG